jgi:hypothetical protein
MDKFGGDCVDAPNGVSVYATQRYPRCMLAACDTITLCASAALVPTQCGMVFTVGEILNRLSSKALATSVTSAKRARSEATAKAATLLYSL